jgi:predicted Zn-dependent peptidase
MIDFSKHILANGLKVIVHKDKSTPLVAVNLLYHVGARDEHPERTGFAHLFEHLMFGGSEHVPVFDGPLQLAGAENNAFTSNDITNYYETIPSQNLETALWLESDRMNKLNFDAALEVQRKVVSEEFKEHYLNQPYGDVWHKLRALAYKVHPYQWPTIGKEIKHIENATLSDVEQFFYKYYRPNNAILVLAGNITPDAGFQLAEKWFSDIPAGEPVDKSLIPQEPEQTEARFLEVHADVPVNAIYKAYHMPARYDNHYFAADLLSDVLSAGRSSRLYHPLVKQQKLFTEISAYITGSLDPGLLVIEGKLADNISPEAAEDALQIELDKIMQDKISDDELQKVKNRIESQMEFGETEILNRAMGLAYAELIGDANIVNTEKQAYLSVTAEQIQQQAQTILRSTNCSTLHYLTN